MHLNCWASTYQWLAMSTCHRRHPLLRAAFAEAHFESIPGRSQAQNSMRGGSRLRAILVSNRSVMSPGPVAAARQSKNPKCVRDWRHSSSMSGNITKTSGLVCALISLSRMRASMKHSQSLQQSGLSWPFGLAICVWPSCTHRPVGRSRQAPFASAAVFGDQARRAHPIGTGRRRSTASPPHSPCRAAGQPAPSAL